MARYIDADALKLDIDLSKGASVLDMAINVIKAVKDAPTADVVPRAEVEEIIGKFECFLCHTTEGRLSKYTYDLRTMETVATDCINETYNDGYAEGRKEVAREIFAEMDGLMLVEKTKELIKALRVETAKERAETAMIMREAADLLEQLLNLLRKAKELNGDKE